MWVITLLLGGAVIWLINYWVNSNFKYWKKQGIPYSTTSPFQQFWTYLFTKKGLTEIILNEYKTLQGHKYGGFFQIFSPTVMICDIDLIHKVCIKDFSYFVDRNGETDVSDLFTESLGTLTGDKWRTLRHKMTPTFTSGKLKMMFHPINENCDEAVSYINNRIGKDIDIRDFVFKVVINIIGNISFGLKVDALNEEAEKNNEFLNISRTFFKPSFTLMMKFLITLSMPKVRNIIKFSMVDKRIEMFFRKLVKDMIAHRENTGEVRNDFLQLMLDQKKKEQMNSISNSTVRNNIAMDSLKEQAQEPEDSELLDQLNYMETGSDSYKFSDVFTEDCIVAQSFLFISGGSETTAATLTFVLYELAINPEIQSKVQDEIDLAISKYGFSYQGIRGMPYMEQCIHEAMRLHPIGPFIFRMCTQNYNIPDTDTVIEKGTGICLPTIGIFQDPQYFPEPERFNPDRFENMDALHPGTLLAFGTGPRMCIAKRLAMLEMKMLVAALLQKFTVKLSPKTQLPLRLHKSSVFLNVVGGVWLQFERRNK